MAPNLPGPTRRRLETLATPFPPLSPYPTTQARSPIRSTYLSAHKRLSVAQGRRTILIWNLEPRVVRAEALTPSSTAVCRPPTRLRPPKQRRTVRWLSTPSPVSAGGIAEWTNLTGRRRRLYLERLPLCQDPRARIFLKAYSMLTPMALVSSRQAIHLDGRLVR